MSTPIPPPSYAIVIPAPLEATEAPGAFTIGSSTRIVVGPGGDAVARVARGLAATMRPATGYRLTVTRAARDEDDRIVLGLSRKLSELGDEGYELGVTPRSVHLLAYRPAGLFHGVQTLRQLLPAAIERGAPQQASWRIRAGTIRDRPRFPWRGAMLDVGRHFFDVAEVKRFVDVMALYKLNRLHLHLTDDQGWRIAIRSWPKLTAIGGRTAVDGDRGGYYTQRQYRDLVSYAADRFVTVVPEIDMPGHTNAALAAYARLNCDGVARKPYTGIEVGFSSLCIRKELTYRFVDDVVREVAAMTPGPYLHIGGDEAHSTDPADYRYFIGRIEAIVRKHGKRMIGWEEIARNRVRRDTIAQHWQDPTLALRAGQQGAKLIMSPATHAYLDMKYAPGTQLGLSWAGTTSVRDAYVWDPATQVDGVGEQSVLGVEAPLWTETAVTFADVEFLAFPRLLGIAEIGWSRREGRSWARYRHRLASHGPRLDALGVGFYRAPGIPWK